MHGTVSHLSYFLELHLYPTIYLEHKLQTFSWGGQQELRVKMRCDLILRPVQSQLTCDRQACMCRQLSRIREIVLEDAFISVFRRE